MKVVFRNGSTLNTSDLVNAACETARSIVVMSVGDNSAQADANTLRVVLALMVRTYEASRDRLAPHDTKRPV